VLSTGSVGAERNLTFTAASLTDNGGANDLRFTGDSGILQADLTGSLDLAGGYWIAPQLLLNANAVTVGGNSVLYGSASTGTALSITTPGVAGE